MRTMVSTILAIAVVVVWQLWRGSSSSESTISPPSTAEQQKPAPEPKTPKEEPAQQPPEPSPLAAEINDPETNIQRDLEILHQILDDYRLLATSGNPSGNNLEITSALTGNNRYGLAPIPRNHSAISPTGELLDRLGTPYFFHNLSAQHLEIQSAGPDKRHHTDDDILISNLPANLETP